MSDEATKAMLGVYAGVGFVPAHEWKLIVEELGRQQADNARLRALVKFSEFYAGDRDGWCQWCGSMDDGADGTLSAKNLHSPRCPAFWPDGRVR